MTQDSRPSERPFLSVVICTYNRAPFLRSALEGICNQKLDPEHYEIIVVDNNSTDGTRPIVAHFRRTYPHVRYAAEIKQGLSHARNRGFQEARGEYLVYNDDDSIAPPEYLSHVFSVLQKNGPDILGGPVYPYYLHPKPPWFRDTYEIRRHADASGFSRTCRVSGGNFIIRKSVLRQLGLFDPEYGMKGGKLGSHEESKVLDQYRFKVPEAEQKVYYSLECSLRHYVPPDKMKIGYMMLRSYISGRMFLRLRALEGRIELSRMMPMLYYSTMDYLVRELKKAGIREADYIDFFRRSFRSIGILTELVLQLAKGGGKLLVWQSPQGSE